MGIYINSNGTAERYDGAPSAAGQSYNNASSGLSATNTQAAIDEVASEKTDSTNLGTVELTTTATAAHAVGTYFILVGQFVKTTVAIGVGDTIAVGTNVATTNIGSVLTELNNNITTLSTLITITETTETGVYAGMIRIPKSYYPDYKAIIPLGGTSDGNYHVFCYWVDQSYYFMISDFSGNKASGLTTTFMAIGIK